eukprot:Gregarina_sp_Poly_1__6149@NODE_324_length_9523_cov_66_749683_g276_i0_p2_GENE_NODE_324_length_9523_cov_66_749683_g276_i0NODE_324_length_9523_cov_66_749683_g276_i0_p2_ORF_typecomplete_len623_score72_63Peptidase_M3/PF01432_20/1_7e40Peptidase_M3_N/PF08439_10/3_6e06Peptidase_M3_N/PF08439_10/6_3e03_NODE_324_length_9523_cov_66_749683_g276_i043056173
MESAFINFPQVFGVKDVFDPKLQNVLTQFQHDAQNFERQYSGKCVTQLGPALLAYNELLGQYTDYVELIDVFASIEAASESVTKTSQTLREGFEKAHAEHCEWFLVQVKALPEDVVLHLLNTDPSVKRFQSFLRVLRLQCGHTLSEEVEKCLSMSSTWYGPGVVTAALMSELGKFSAVYLDPHTNEKQTLNSEEIRNKLTSKDWRVRHEAARAQGEATIKHKLPEFSVTCLNVVTGMLAYEVKERKYEGPRSMKNCEMGLSDSSVDRMLTVCRNEGPSLCKRYYNLKKNLLKRTQGESFKFSWSDRCAQLHLRDCVAESTKFAWDECLDIVRTSFYEFSAAWGSLFDRLVKEERIDAGHREGKRGGAFCTSMTKRFEPVIVSTYTGSLEAVMTIAHEAGHANHFFLACKQDALQQTPPPAICEIASVFSETLVFQRLIKSESVPAKKLERLMGYLDGIINTTIRQISFDLFEEKIHKAREVGVLTLSELNKFWRECTETFYGKEGEVFEEYDHFDSLWSHVHHFQLYPFYVYGYAFADLMVGLFYHLHASNAVADFPTKLEEMFASGYLNTFEDMVKPFGLDATSEGFWQKALNGRILPLLEEAERLAQNLEFSNSQKEANE